MIQVSEAGSPDDIAAADALFRDYAAFVAPHICLYDFDTEMTLFPAPYVPPRGVLLVARDGGRIVGAVGVRPLGPPHKQDRECEMKRMYVRADARRTGAGRALANASIAWARGAGYRVMKLDTIPELTAAVALYRELGFRPCPAYNVNPPDRVLFFERELT
ncbi:MAG: GNAT family N-acetyltransferase [Sphingomonadales bacterium]